MKGLLREGDAANRESDESGFLGEALPDENLAEMDDDATKDGYGGEKWQDGGKIVSMSCRRKEGGKV